MWITTLKYLLFSSSDNGWIDLSAHNRLAYWSAWTERQREGACEPATVDVAEMRLEVHRERERRLAQMGRITAFRRRA